MSAMSWFRWYNGDRSKAPLRAMTPAGRWLWLALHELASEAGLGGIVELAPGVPYSEADLADQAAIPLEEVRPALDYLVRVRWIEEHSTHLYIPDFGKRQFQSDNSTERANKSKERKKQKEQQQRSGGATLQQRFGDVPATPPETDSEPDTETEANVDDDAQRAPPPDDRKDCLAVVNRARPDWVLSGEDYHEFLSYEDQLPWAVIRKAVDKTLAAGAKPLAYCLKILDDYASKGIQSVQEVEALDAERKARIDRAQSIRASPSGGSKPATGLAAIARVVQQAQGGSGP